MKQHYSINSFTPNETTLDIIKQFAYTYRPLLVDGRRIPFCLN